jgi:uncharacterized protein DUF4234
MAFLRCPRCRTVIEAPAKGVPTCPNCGFTAAAPRLATTAYGSTAPPAPAPGGPPAAVGPSARPQPAQAAAPYAAPYPTAPPPQQAVGRPRSFWVSFLLGIITLGIYYYVWNYKVFRELDREHGERHAAGWFWTGLAVQIMGFLVFVAFVGYVVATTPEGQTPDTGFVPFFVYPFSLVATAFYLSYAFREISKLERYRQSRGLADGLAPVWFLLLYIFGALLVVPMIVAYFLVQKSINEVWWNVYTQRQIPWPL